MRRIASMLSPLRRPQLQINFPSAFISPVRFCSSLPFDAKTEQYKKEILNRPTGKSWWEALHSIPTESWEKMSYDKIKDSFGIARLNSSFNLDFDGTVPYAILIFNKVPYAFIFLSNGIYKAFVMPTQAGQEELKAEKWKVVERVEHVKDNIYLVTFNANVETGNEVGYYLESLQAGPMGVGQQLHNLEGTDSKQKDKSLPNGLETYFRFYKDVFHAVLRPVPYELWSMPFDEQDIRDKVENLEKNPFPGPWVYPGGSGTGKTAAALTFDVRRYCGGRWIVGVYIKASKDIGSDEATFPEAVANEIIRRCKQAASRDLSNTAFYIIMDEMGHAKPAAHSVVEHRTVTFTTKVRAVLAKTYDGVESCQFLYAIVGAGVTGPTERSTSMPKGYIRMTAPSSTEELFVKKLSEKNPNGSYGFTLKQANFVLKAIHDKPHLRLLLTNRRCSYVMALALLRLIKVNIKRHFVIATEENAAEFVTNHASYLEADATNEYVNQNSWGTLKDEKERRFYASFLLSLVFTQPHGYHLLPSEVAVELSVTLGAIDDSLQLEISSAQQKIPTCDFGYDATDPQFGDSKISFLTNTEATTGATGNQIAMRFVVPPAMVIVAINILTGTVGRQLKPKSYEHVISIIVLAVLDVFRWQAQYQSLALCRVPLHHIIPSAALQSEEGEENSWELKLPVKPIVWEPKSIRMYLINCAPSLKAIDASGIDTKRNGKFRVDEIIDEVRAQEKENGVAIVSAGEGTPLSDLTIISKNQCIGIELKNYEQGGLVPVDTLRKCCYQMGYHSLHMTPIFEKFLVKLVTYEGNSKVRKSAIVKCLPPALTSMFYKSTWTTAELAEGGGPTRCVATFKGYTPDGNPLPLELPNLESEISHFGCIFHMALRDDMTKPRECLILGSPSQPLLPEKGLKSVYFSGPHAAIKAYVWQKYKKTSSNNTCLIASAILSVADMAQRCYVSLKIPSGSLALPESTPMSAIPKLSIEHLRVFINDVEKTYRLLTEDQEAYIVQNLTNGYGVCRYPGEPLSPKVLGIECDSSLAVLDFYETYAQDAGLCVDDVIVQFCGQKVRNMCDFVDALVRHFEFDKLFEVVVQRGITLVTITVTMPSKKRCS